MKIKVLDRIILFFGALLTILAGAALFVSGLQIQGLFAMSLPLWIRVLLIVCGVLLAVFGMYILALPRRLSPNHKDFVVQRTDNGELRIAVKAIENLVQKCIDLHDEIQVISMRILNGREGVVVDLFVSLANNISIPLAVASLQKQIKQYLVASSGIEVKEVRVSVESTQDEPEVVAEAIEEEADAGEKNAADKKLPLHQRLFSKPDEPAVMPQAPEEETQEAPSPAAPDNAPAPEAEPAQETVSVPADENAPSFQETPAEEAIQEQAASETEEIDHE